MKIGVLTFHRSINYGAYLQACALCSRLNKEGYDAEIIDYRMKKEEKWYAEYRNWPLLKKIMKYKQYSFKKKLTEAIESGQTDNTMIKKSKEFLCSDSYEQFTAFVRGKYDVIITGSDEIWKLNSLRGFPSPYWLPGDLGCRKFSYAASSRSNINLISDEKVPLICNLLEQFEYISVRDKMSYDLLQEQMNEREIYLDCDPSFLSDFPIEHVDLYEYLQNKCKLDGKKKNVVIMIYDPKGKVVRYIRKQLSGQYNLIGLADRHSGLINIPDLSPKEWLTVIANADFVISSFFHGVCFSIVERTPFLAVETVEKSSKLSYLLQSSLLSERYIDFGLYDTCNFDELIQANMNVAHYEEFIRNETRHFRAFLNALDKDNTLL